jgi:type I restriction enzyme M protein
MLGFRNKRLQGERNVTSEELKKLKDNLWAAADRLRANSDLKSSEYSTPVLGLIFLKFADNKYSLVENEIKQELEAQKARRKQRTEIDIAIEKCGFYLPSYARYTYLLNLPEEEEIDKALKEAMIAIEEYKPELKGTLPQDEYFKLTRTDKTLPATLLKIFADIPQDASGDVFGQIYEYFLGKFALAEGQGGGEFFTPTSVVKFMVEVIEPYRGTIFDPACGSGGMFVQSSNFIERRKKEMNDHSEKDLYVYGQEKTLDTVKLAKMNLAVNGLRGDIKQANTYYEDPFDCYEKFDYVMANPPFNVDDVQEDRVIHEKRFNEYGIPQTKTKSKKKETKTVPNANYLWINLFASSLKKNGKAALVMANSAFDARHSEYEIRKNLIQHGLIDAMVTLPSNMFNTVTLPATLWFFNKRQENQDKILFIDARNIYRQIDRSHREFTEEQIQNLATIARLYRGEKHRFTELVNHYFEQWARPIEHIQLELSQAIHFTHLLQQGLMNWLQQTKLVVSENQSTHINQLQLKLENKSLPNEIKVLNELERCLKAFSTYQNQVDLNETESANLLQREMRLDLEIWVNHFQTAQKQLSVFYKELRELYICADKELKASKDKMFKGIISLKEVNEKLDTLNSSLSEAHYFLTQIKWLHERFPEARYEDVIGLCKCASMEEIEEQDYSLNPGRYVGIVIEDDGMTEEEFKGMILSLNGELNTLYNQSNELGKVIMTNINKLVKSDVL